MKQQGQCPQVCPFFLEGLFFHNFLPKIKYFNNIFGNIFGNTVNLPTNGTRPTIIVNPDVMGATGVSLPDFTRFQINKTLWWEFEGRDARS